MTFGERLAELRKKQYLSQSELAKRLNISKSSLAMYETDKRQPNFETQTKIADFFNVTTDYLLGRKVLKKDIELEDIVFEVKEPTITYDSFFELNKLIKEFGIEQMGFLDIDKWKDLSPEDIDEIRRHFEWVAQKAKERNKEKD